MTKARRTVLVVSEGMERTCSSESRHRLALLLAGGGARCRRMLASAATTADTRRALLSAGGPPALQRTARGLDHAEVDRVLDRIAASGWRWLVPGDAGYPALLGSIADPPLGLFVRGSLSPGPLVAVVGSRKASRYGLQVARMLGEELARAGVVVVSGMARGVDAAAHRGALAASGESWAFWGAGPDRIYPPEHRSLAEEMASSGALMTEYLPGTPPRRHHFPERNRLIAGACQATVVVEAAARSGALATARAAVEEGREVFAVPGPIFSHTSVGPNTLLRVGARPLLVPSDVLEVVRPGYRAPAVTTTDPGRGDELLAHLPPGCALTADQIAAAAGMGVGDVLARLLNLEVSGTVERAVDGRYARARGMAAAAR